MVSYWIILGLVLKKWSFDRKIAIPKFRNRDHLAILLSNKDRRSPRDRKNKITDRDQKIGDRSCLANQCKISFKNILFNVNSRQQKTCVYYIHIECFGFIDVLSTVCFILNESVLLWQKENIWKKCHFPWKFLVTLKFHKKKCQPRERFYTD